MSNTLLETLSKQMKAPQAAAPVEQTQQAQGLLRAKLSGKDTGGGLGGSGPRRSNIAEQAVAQDTSSQLAQKQQEGRFQGMALEQAGQEQEQQRTDQFLNIQENLENTRADFARQAADIMGELERAGKKLDSSKDAAKLEQLGFLLRFQDQQYVTELENQGRLQNLHNDINFKDALYKEVMGENIELFQNNSQFQKFMNADRRTFEMQLAQIDINYAMQVAHQAMKSSQEQAIFGTAGNILTAGLTFAEKYENNKATDAADKPKP